MFKDYDCIIDYHLEKANVVVDALSRKTVSILSLQHSRWRFTPNGALLAQLKAKLDLKQIIINAQKNDVALQQAVQLVRDENKTDYSMVDDGGLYYKNRLCLPADKKLKKKLMHKAHNTIFTMLLEGNKMYQDLKQYYWWRGMKKDIVDYVSKCLTCQQVKAEHQVPFGMLNPIPIPQWK